ncbi:ABC transporter substrate-binding protein [Burkholderia sp. WAC0059]|uniref:ABC transporter substrate-binding protein n=1 Tax=Burkholderia sp. WAC0059 TaxID=2066022 RepID=UPI002155B854|nr:ABC transporter substrate-binding protein [Burkholderia sp. WAC0059]
MQTYPVRRALNAVAATLALTGALLAQPAFAADTVTVALAIPPTVTDGGIWSIGNELGIWKKENLDVRTLTFDGAGALVPQVASGHVTIGLPVVDPILASYAAGRTDLPVRYFYNATPAYTMEFAVLAGSPIKTLADLKGKKIGVGALTWGTIPSTRAVLREAGLAQGDYDILPVGVLGPGFHALITGQIDALNYNSSWHDMLELSGTPLRRIVYPGIFGQMNANGFIANTAALQANPGLYARFGRAYTEAQVACAANVQLCVESFWRQHPEAKPTAGDPATNLKNAEELVQRRLARVMFDPSGHERTPGEFDLAIIRQFVARMAADGEFASTRVPVDALFTNELVPQFRQFDENAIRAEARAAH